ncbi:maltooligosyl trehalose hydrolase [Terriglobus roseus DSM 18391]|uniref:Malto-oligosyltrehalose trehalohydrolase n=1 Tax=Terriglobus roseus (strain DSM 18391 / NRRL B-41598 / KBS 63) TaxID=926566 RepID=I3ZDI3_TERRK|nr:malto-oligosyltrehalose trehalohydrolase [Terriglobus roseus]AFL87301.1 maltooligosyl trehalose hydrolase [Terriglobus roseus DSM 18391]
MHKFGIWAPKAQKMSLSWRGQVLPMNGPSHRGWWTLEVEEAGCGDRYAFLLDDDPTPYPDPRSVRQPDGVHGASELYRHDNFTWHDQLWRGSPKTGAIIYELHIGTFSAEGTFDGAIPKLQYLAELGVTHVEVMPVAAWAGKQGWGYDSVSLFATHEHYGGPDGFKRFVDACHATGLSVILDVVYNHFGPVGNYTGKFGPYLNHNRKTPWGDAVNLDQEGSDEVRRFFVDNAIMWLKDYHCDGLRFDAVHAFIDLSAVHFMEQLSTEVERLGATVGKEFYLIAESDLNDPRVIRPREANGYGMDAQWSDDFHHSLFAVLYSPKEGETGYYGDFGTLADLHKSLQHAYVYDGQYSGYRKRRHGRPADGLSAHHFIHFDQNHDQVGNRGWGERLEHLIETDTAKLSIGLVLLAPYTPMLFMGEEWACSTPFLYFADHEDEEMRRLVAAGRKSEFAAFGFDGDVPDPEQEKTYTDSKLKWDEQKDEKHADFLAWTKALIKLRRSRVCFNDGDMHHLHVSSDEEARTLVMERDEARVVVNFGDQPFSFALLEGETLELVSRSGVDVRDGYLNVPPMTLAVFLSTSEQAEDRKVEARSRS